MQDGKRIGIALSGGGYRATLFGLGSLWRLNDVGVLGHLDRITSVSGGSIAAAVLAKHWTELEFDQGRATNFAEVIADRLRAFCSITIDWKAGLLGMLTPAKTAGEFLGDVYRKRLLGDTRLKDIPDPKAGGPRFIFYATNLQTGRSFRFRQDMLADYVLGVNLTANPRLSDVVAASSAFPPVFSPVVFRTDPSEWKDPKKELSNLATLRTRISLTDGGVYDNMGLESLIGNVDIVLVSDAGAPFKIEERPWEDNLLQLGRIRDILIDQTRALRKRWLVDELEANRLFGGYWGITTEIDSYEATDSLTKDNDRTRRLDGIPTRLREFSKQDQGELINWGYALADVALRVRAKLNTPPATGWPVPEWSLDR